MIDMLLASEVTMKRILWRLAAWLVGALGVAFSWAGIHLMRAHQYCYNKAYTKPMPDF